MADDTFAALKMKRGIVRGRQDLIEQNTEEWFVKGDMKRMDVVTRFGQTEDSGKVIRAAAGNPVYGVVYEYTNENDKPNGDNMDATLTVGKLVKVLRPTGGLVTLGMYLATGNSTVTWKNIRKGDTLMVDSSGERAGGLQRHKAAQFDDETTVTCRVGKAASERTFSTSDIQILLVDY